MTPDQTPNNSQSVSHSLTTATGGTVRTVFFFVDDEPLLPSLKTRTSRRQDQVQKDGISLSKERDRSHRRQKRSILIEINKINNKNSVYLLYDRVLSLLLFFPKVRVSLCEARLSQTPVIDDDGDYFYLTTTTTTPKKKSSF
jgi:hypothetical protein